MPSILVIFGRNVAKYRKLKNITQDELAKEIGVSKTTIWNLENGQKWVTASTVEKLAKFLQIKETDLFQTEEEFFRKLGLKSKVVEAEVSLSWEQFLDVFPDFLSKLSEEQKNALAKMIKAQRR